MLARLFDPSGKPDEPWIPCPLRGMWCAKYGDRLPASLISKRTPMLYSKGDSTGGGFLLRTEYVELYCAYPTDGSTMNKMCDPPGRSPTCLPGCPTGHDDARWCQTRAESRGSSCAWQPDQLREMLLAQEEVASGGKKITYNELILDPTNWVDSMPHILAAVFFPSWASARQQAMARSVHAAICKRYQLSNDELPLIRYTHWVGFELA